ncbi:MAG: hypothetical protein H6745_20455 [Deltaproteobacteria bacterium]|nr:hypothetical protein [Deltaproteobacteria bacterium]
MTEVVLARKVSDLRSRAARVRELLPESLDVFVARRTDVTLDLRLVYEAARDDLGDLDAFASTAFAP